MSEYEFLKNKLKNSKKADIDEIKKEEIDCINEIKINKDNPSEERTIEFIKKTKNPYFFLVDDTKVKIEYGESNKKLSECLTSFVLNKINSNNY